MPAFERYPSSTSRRTAGRVEHDVVVAEQEEGRALDRVERLVGGVGEAGTVVEAPHERPGQRPRPPAA